MKFQHKILLALALVSLSLILLDIGSTYFLTSIGWFELNDVYRRLTIEHGFGCAAAACLAGYVGVPALMFLGFFLADRYLFAYVDTFAHGFRKASSWAFTVSLSAVYVREIVDWLPVVVNNLAFVFGG